MYVWEKKLEFINNKAVVTTFVCLLIFALDF